MAASGEDMKESKEFTFGVTGDCCGCQKGVGVVGNTWVEGDGIDGVRGETWRWVAGPVLDRTRGQLLTRPDGLLRTVGWILSNEL